MTAVRWRWLIGAGAVLAAVIAAGCLWYARPMTLEKLIPDQRETGMYRYPGEEHYRAVETWPDAQEYLPDGDRTALWNCDAHLKATLLGSSQVLDVTEGKLGAGATGYVYFVDFDRTRPRSRRCKIVIMGE